MGKAKSKGLVPERRFPEFRGAGEWEVSKLKFVAKRATQRNIGAGETRVLTNSAEHGIVDQRDYFDKDIADQNNLESYFIVEEGDYVYNPRVSTFAPVGPISKNRAHRGVMSPLYTVFRFNNSSNVFYEHYFRTTGWHAYMRVISNSGARHDRMAISADDFMEMPVPAPGGKEQQKIADCLTSIDELITAHTQKLAALKTHKKGLMQQLFPADGETVPKLRFPEFRGKGEWELKELGDVVKSVKTGKLDANAMVANGPYRFYTCAKNFYQIDHYAFEGEALLIAGNGAYLGYIHHVIGKFNAYQRTYVLQNFETNVCFLKCLLDRYLPSRILLEKKDGNTPYIVLSTITEMPLLFPKRDEEQQKIADCLTSIDELIIAQTQKVESLKVHKKGLMQQLFPAMVEANE